MKKYFRYLLFAFVAPVLICNTGNAQTTLLKEAHAHVNTGDTLVLRLQDYIGEIVQWQDSQDGENWADISGATADSLWFEADQSTYFRTSVLAGDCDAFYSDVIFISVTKTFEELLAGETSKTWKLYRIGSSMGVGPNLEHPTAWWFLENDGTRPCAYYHEFTFHRNGDYVFDDKGFMWGEADVFHPDLVGECLEAIPDNMIGPDGEDLSAWLSGMHTFEYNPNTNMITLNGLGAWIGLVRVGTNDIVTVPQTSLSFGIEITQHDGHDLMYVTFVYDWGVWIFNYAFYSDPSLEPDVVEDQDSWGENLPNITPEEIFITFAARDAENMATIDTVASGSTVEFAVDDPTDASAQKVGKFIRTAGTQWQELKFRTTPELYDIQFDNFTVAKVDIYIPANTAFSDGGLQRFFVFGFADMSETQYWWESPVQFEVAGDNVVVGEWHTYMFNLTAVKERDDLDMIFIGIGGGGHEAVGTFYVRNLIFE